MLPEVYHVSNNYTYGDEWVNSVAAAYIYRSENTRYIILDQVVLVFNVKQDLEAKIWNESM